MATRRYVTLQARGSATARVAAIRVATVRMAANLRRYDGATALLRWRVKPMSCFGEPGRQLRYSATMTPPGQRLHCSATMARAGLTATEQNFFIFIFFSAASTASFTRERKRTTNSFTRKYTQERKRKRKPERERKRELWNLFGLALLNCWFSSSNLSTVSWFSITQAPFSKLPPVAPAEQQQ